MLLRKQWERPTADSMSSKGFIVHASVAARRMLVRGRVISLSRNSRWLRSFSSIPGAPSCSWSATSIFAVAARHRSARPARLRGLTRKPSSPNCSPWSKVNRCGSPVADPRSLSTLQLVSHIVNQRHAYLRKTLPLVELLAARVVEAHSEHETRLAMHATLRALRGTLESHLDHEESVLFPLLIRGGRGRRTREQLDSMRAEHLRVGDTLRKIRTLADRFVLPSWACATYAALIAELEALEQDTLERVHLENNVLAPRFDAGPLAPTMQRRRSGSACRAQLLRACPTSRTGRARSSVRRAVRSRPTPDATFS